MYLKKIKKIISKSMGIAPEEIEPTSHFQEDLNIGDLEFTELIEILEEKYKIDLSDYIDDIETVGDLVEILTEEIE